MPLVSVVIPTHNRPEMLAEALASIRAQTFTDYEIIVVSNGESAEMRERSRAAAEQSGASWFALDAGNVSAARNLGVERAAGKWIAFLDDDDLWMPEKLERQMAEAQCSGTDMVACDSAHSYLDGHTAITYSRPPDGLSYLQALGNVWCPAVSGVVVRNAAITAVGGFDLRLPAIEDTDLWRRIAWRHTIQPVNMVLVCTRHGHPSLTWRQERRINIRKLQYFIKMRRDTPVDLRGTLPSFAAFVARCVMGICFPWIPRLRYRLRLRTRIKALAARLGSVASS